MSKQKPVRQYDTMTREQARAAKMKPITDPYCPAEYFMLDRAIADLKRGNVRFGLVRGSTGIQIFR